MINEKELKNKLNKYLGNGEKRYLYRDAEYDPRGINYTPFLQLRFDTFNKNHIQDYTIEGWRILCYLITKAKDNKYIATTPSIIMDSLNMTRHKIISGLNNLFKIGIIIGNINNKQYSNKNKVKVINDKIEILILYADKELYPHAEDENGYKALPLDFISRSILELDEYAWAILTFLIVRYRYFKPDRAINNDTGEITYYINEYMYAYPKQTDIADMLGCERKKLIKHIDNLEKLGYIKTEMPYLMIPKTNSEGIKYKECYKYHIKLLERKEYMYYHVLLVEDNKIEKGARKIGFEKYIEKEKDNKLETITNKMYLETHIGEDVIKQYHTEY